MESQSLHLPFLLQNNNVNEASHQHSQKRKEAEHMPQTLVLLVGAGRGVLLLVGNPSTTPALRAPWRFLIRWALPMQTHCRQHGLSKLGAKRRGSPTNSKQVLPVLAKEDTPPQKPAAHPSSHQSQRLLYLCKKRHVGQPQRAHRAAALWILCHL